MTSRFLLAIDTATARCSAGLLDLDTGEMAAFAEPEIGKGHAEQLMDIVAGVLGEAGASYRDIARLAVVVGPGSFTGLRVGVAAARGLALALRRPAVGISSLEALAREHGGGPAPCLAVIDAKRGEVYAALYDAGGKALREPAALAPEALALFLGADHVRAPNMRIVGSGAAIAAAALGRLSAEDSDAETYSIGTVARIAAGRDGEGPPRPLYLRGADAKPQSDAGLTMASAGGIAVSAT